MVKFTQAFQVGEFHREFAHLALRPAVNDLAILSVARSPPEKNRV
jgi:hypothetical protein